MSPEIVYSTDALIDLDEAWDFTVETSGDPDLAFQQVDALLEAVEGTRSFPLAGSRLDVVVGTPTDSRYVVAGRLLAVDSIEEHFIRVDRIFDTRQDWVSVLVRRG